MATRNIVPRATGEGSIGTSAKIWNDGYYSNLHPGGVFVDSNEMSPNIDNNVDLGRSGQRYKNVYGVNLIGTASTAQYADLAEKFSVRGECTEGTVLSVCNDETADLEVCDVECAENVAGVFSTSPGYLMNSELDGIPVALAGRVPVRVIGPVRKGQVIVSAGGGCARAVENMNEKIDKMGYSMKTNLESSEKLVDCIVK